MANIILIKRGQATNINSASLQEGELALGFNAAKNEVELYVGNGSGTPVLVNGAKIAAVLAEAKSYVDGKITDLIGGAPEAYDTLKEIADYISTHQSAYEALMTAAGNKLDKPATDGTTGQVLKRGADGKPVWGDETDTTYGPATTAAAGLMSAEDKTKLNGIAEGANNYVHPASHDASMIDQDATHRFVSDTEKTTWNGKIGTTDTIDGGTF